jgi:hypothetical protein
MRQLCLVFIEHRPNVEVGRLSAKSGRSARPETDHSGTEKQARDLVRCVVSCDAGAVRAS